MTLPILTADDTFEAATNLRNEALALLQDPDCSAEDMEKAERMEKRAVKLIEMSNTTRQIEEQRAEAEAKMNQRPNQWNNAPDNEDAEPEVDPYGGFKSIGEWFQAAYTFKKNRQPDPRLSWWGGEDNHVATPLTDAKAMSSAVGESAGFLVQPEFQRRVYAVAANQAIMRSRATIVRMNSRTLTINVLDQTGTDAGEFHWFGGIVTYWLEEAGTLTETQPNFRQMTLTAHNLTAYTVSSIQLLDDSGTAIEDYLMGERGFPAAITHTEDYAFLQGDGVGKPEGVIHSSGRFVVNRTTANTVVYEDLTKMITHMLPNANAIWVAHQSMMEELMNMNGPSGNPVYLWGSAAQGVPSTLLGRPIIFTDKLPFKGTEGDLIYIDPSYYLIGDRQQITIDMSTEEHFRTNQVSWRAMCRVDGHAWLSAPITYQDGTFQVSPFIVLGDVAT